MDKYIVIKRSELEQIHRFNQEAVNLAVKMINLNRKEAGKKPNTYIVINRDEPYADQVIGIMKKHGHDINDSEG